MVGANRVQVDLRAQAVLVVFDPVGTDVDILHGALAHAGYKPRRETVTDG
ncbi:MAG: heavy-metal-associated domain-containing protein [Chloroflexota bacterium]|nr:heavy-metal-associated domain-containing protein [Chloroflexota bacterium]